MDNNKDEYYEFLQSVKPAVEFLKEHGNPDQSDNRHSVRSARTADRYLCGANPPFTATLVWPAQRETAGGYRYGAVAVV